jgi:hypothetical protein
MKPVVVMVSVVAVVYLVLALALVEGWISIPEKSCDRGDILKPRPEGFTSASGQVDRGAGAVHRGSAA